MFSRSRLNRTKSSYRYPRSLLDPDFRTASGPGEMDRKWPLGPDRDLQGGTPCSGWSIPGFYDCSHFRFLCWACRLQRNLRLRPTISILSSKNRQQRKGPKRRLAPAPPRLRPPLPPQQPPHRAATNGPPTRTGAAPRHPGHRAGKRHPRSRPDSSTR